MSQDRFDDAFRQLREMAEEQIRARAEDRPPLDSGGASGLIHELEVHQMELSLQNEELRRAQEELQTSRALYMKLYNLAPVGYMTIDGAGIILRANQTLAEMLRLDAAGLIMRPFIDFILEQDRPIFYGRLKAFSSRPEGKHIEVRLVNGVHARLEGRLAEADPLAPTRRTPDKTFLIAVHDVSELKRTEAELIEAKEMAESANRTKSEFLANMSHEIRTPLNGVLGMLQLLGHSALNEDQRSCVDTGIAAAESLLAVINDILDFSKIEADKLEIISEPFWLHTLLRNVTGAFKEQVILKRLQLYYNIAPETPAQLIGDSGRIRQALFNLIGNAVKFSDSGEVRVEVTPHGPRTPDGRILLKFTVTDQGAGIPKDRLEQIFEPFVQVDGSYSRRYQGTGLGLGIVKRLVELMGGKIFIESEPGKGTTVSFTLLLGYGRATEAPERAKAPSAPESPGYRVLVVEDDELNQMVLTRFLNMAGHSYVVAASGEAAIEIFGRDRFDCVLMDIQMPGLNGMETTRILRKMESSRNERTPIIALTAHAMKGDRELFLASGMDGYLAKPVSYQELVASIAKPARPESGSP